MLSQERLESAVGPLNDSVCLPLFREFWDQNSYNFVASYRDYIDLKIGAC